MATTDGRKRVVRVEHRDGAIVFAVDGAGEAVLAIGNVTPEVLKRAAIHGLVQRISDAAAGHKAPGDKLAAMARLVEHYASGAGTWELPREAGDGIGADSRLILQAIVDVRGRDVATWRERLAGRAEAQGVTLRQALAAVATEPAIAARLAELRPAPRIAASDLLADDDADAN